MDEEENDCRPEIIEEEPDDGESHLPCSVPLMSSKEYLKPRKKSVYLGIMCPAN